MIKDIILAISGGIIGYLLVKIFPNGVNLGGSE